MQRRFLVVGAAAFATLILPSTSRASQARRIALRHSGTGARFEGIWHDGQAPDAVAMAELSQALADPGCEPARAFDPDTIELVWHVTQRTRMTGELEVRSGFRTPQANRRAQGAGDSLHLRASAVDLGIPAGRMPAVAEAALRLGRGGVGVYRQRGFIHLDSGPVRNWSDGAPRRALSAREREIERIAAAWQGTR